MFACIDVLVRDPTTLYCEDVIKLFKMYPKAMKKSQDLMGFIAGAMIFVTPGTKVGKDLKTRMSQKMVGNWMLHALTPRPMIAILWKRRYLFQTIAPALRRGLCYDVPTTLVGSGHLFSKASFLTLTVTYIAVLKCLEPIPSQTAEAGLEAGCYWKREGNTQDTSPKTNMTMKNPPWMKMYFLLNMGIFQCHVSFQERTVNPIVDDGWNITFEQTRTMILPAETMRY